MQSAEKHLPDESDPHMDGGFDPAVDEALVAAAIGLRPLLLRNAQAVEDRGELTEEVVEAVERIGAWRMATPRRWGGLHVSSNAMARVALELAKGCPSTAWAVGVTNSSAWLLAIMGDDMQEAVFGGRARPPIVSSVGVPTCKARPVEGGYIVNGRWGYASGCHHAEWVHAAVMVEGAAAPGVVAMPMADVAIENTWQVAGMRGSGSDTIVAVDVFVPAACYEGLDKGIGFHAPGKRHIGEASDYWPPLPLLRSKALGVIIGCAEGLLDHVIETTRDRSIVHTTYTRKADSHVYQAGVGQAAARIQAARLIMEASTREVDAAALRREPLTHADRVRHRGETCLAVELLTGAVDKLMNLAGSSAFATSNEAQRYWRDFSVGARHAVTLPEVGYEVYGRALLGVEPNITIPDFI